MLDASLKFRLLVGLLRANLESNENHVFSSFFHGFSMSLLTLAKLLVATVASTYRDGMSILQPCHRSNSEAEKGKIKKMQPAAVSDSQQCQDTLLANTTQMFFPGSSDFSNKVHDCSA